MTRVVAKHESEVPKMGKIGVIGGFGQWATLDIIERICRVSAERVSQYGNRGYPLMNIRLANKAPMVLNPDGSYPEKLEPSPEFLEAAKYVSKDSDFLIIPSNTPHLFVKDVEKVTNKKVLSIVDVTVAEAIKRGYKKVGVLAIGLTLEKRLYQNPLEANGISAVVITKEMSDKLDDEGVYPLQEGMLLKDIKPVAKEIVSYLRTQRVDGVILGCTEIPILLGEAANDPDILNPNQLLAEAVVEKCLQLGSKV